MLGETYNPINEIDSVSFDIQMEEAKVKEANKRLAFLRGKKEFLIQAVGALKND